jgi:hypothetical protein
VWGGGTTFTAFSPSLQSNPSTLEASVFVGSFIVLVIFGLTAVLLVVAFGWAMYTSAQNGALTRRQLQRSLAATAAATSATATEEPLSPPHSHVVEGVGNAPSASPKAGTKESLKLSPAGSVGPLSSAGAAAPARPLGSSGAVAVNPLVSQGTSPVSPAEVMTSHYH